MDERIARLKVLKKAYKKVRNRKTRLWRVLWWIFTVLILAAVGMWLYVSFYKTPVMRFIDLQLWEPVKALLGLGSLRWFGALVKCYALPIAALVALLWTVCLLLWIGKVRQSHKTGAFLDYRTLKFALQAEKDERRE